MAWAFSKKEDECFIDGDGTSTYGGIVGLRTKIIDGNHAAGAVDGASGNDTIPEMDAADLDNVRAALPEYAEMDPKWLVSKAFKNKVHDAITRAAGGNTMEMLGNEKPKAAYLGDEIVVSQAMPKSLTADYSNLAMAFYGDFSLACALGDRRGFAVQVLRERYAEYRQIGVLGFERFDINIHDLGDGDDAGAVVGLIGQ
jgi:HK97 family phage major capsid protein